MSNGADKVTVQEVLLALTAEIHRMNGKMDGFVTHERFAQILNDVRREIHGQIEVAKGEAKQDTTDVETRARDVIEDRHSDAMAAMEAMATKIVKQGFKDERAAEAHQIKRLRLYAVLGAGVGGGGGIIAIIMTFFRGMGAS